MSVSKEIRNYVYGQICSLSGCNPIVNQKLAMLRRGVGHTPDEVPMCWGLLFEKAPDSWWKSLNFTTNECTTKVTKEEWAVFTAMTLFAWSSQGNGRGKTNVSDVSLGQALANLAGYDMTKQEHMRESLSSLVSVDDMISFNIRMRRICSLLKQGGIGFDYAMFASDVYCLQWNQSAKQGVILRWCRDFQLTINKMKGNGDKNE